MAVLHYHPGQTLRNPTVGLAVSGPSRHLQLFRPGRPGGYDAAVRGFGTGSRDLGQIQGIGDPSTGTKRRIGNAAGALGCSAEPRDPQLLQTGNNNLTEAFKDNVVIDYAGLRTNDLTTSARSRLRDLVNLYVSNM